MFVKCIILYAYNISRQVKMKRQIKEKEKKRKENTENIMKNRPRNGESNLQPYLTNPNGIWNSNKAEKFPL